MCEYLTYTKLDGCKRGDAVQRETAFEIPNYEANGAEVICGSVDTKLFKVEYSLHCFIKWASIFEPGVGQVIDFPITVLNRQQKTEGPITFDSSYKVNARMTELDVATEGQVNLHRPEQWTELRKVAPLNMYQAKVDDEGHRFGCSHLSAVIYDPATMPLPEANPQYIFPLVDDARYEYRDIWKVNDPEWREKNTQSHFKGVKDNSGNFAAAAVPRIEQEESSISMADNTQLGKTKDRLVLSNQVADNADEILDL
jgi:hypothetical protein